MLKLLASFVELELLCWNMNCLLNCGLLVEFIEEKYSWNCQVMLNLLFEFVDRNFSLLNCCFVCFFSMFMLLLLLIGLSLFVV